MPATSPLFAASPEHYESLRNEVQELRAALSEVKVDISKTNADTLQFLFRIYYFTTLAGLIGFMVLFSRV